MKKGFLFAAILFVAASFNNTISAQSKIGYFEDQSVIALFPGIQKIDTVLRSYQQDSLQDEYNYTLKDYQVKDSIYRKDSVDLSKRPKALQMATDDLNRLKYKLINWQQYSQQAMEQKQEALLLPYRQKIAAALAEVIREQKYDFVLKQESLSPYTNPSIADNLTIRVAMKLKLALPKEVEEAFRVATGGAPASKAPATAPAVKAPAKKG
ncbi:MAG: OmpH family outer membrane protein [Bacteroidetes bacterium]|nr:OmpH family outer membrane protein [Bacteroidota bacterium]